MSTEFSKDYEEAIQYFVTQKANKDPAERLTICLNETRGRTIFRDEPNYRVLLFLISKHSEVLGELVESDFTIIYFKIEIQNDQDSPSSDDRKMRESSTDDGSPNETQQAFKSSSEFEALSAKYEEARLQIE